MSIAVSKSSGTGGGFSADTQDLWTATRTPTLRVTNPFPDRVTPTHAIAYLRCTERPEGHQHNPTPRDLNNHINPVNWKIKRANINIATLNINGFMANSLTYLKKWSMVNQTLNEHKIAILALQKMHLD